MTAYSSTPLLKKLGFKNGQQIRVHNAPGNYFELLGEVPDSIMIRDYDFSETDLNGIHYFGNSKVSLQQDLPHLISSIDKDGFIWISWPKKESKVESSIDENIVRELGLSFGIVDIKVAAIDKIWSGLKFVIRKENR